MMDKLDQSDHFFPVVFDYPAHTAYAFGVVSVKKPEIRVELAQTSGWDCWMGPQLWKVIGQELHWGEDIGDSETVNVVTKNWEQVNSHFCCR